MLLDTNMDDLVVTNPVVKDALQPRQQRPRPH